MTFVGRNMTMVCKDLKWNITQKAIYVQTHQKPVTLYHSPDIAMILNLPKEYLKTYSAWYDIPSFYTGWIGDTVVGVIKGKKIKLPTLVCTNTNEPVVIEKDIFTLMTKRWSDLPRPYDALYTTAHMNDMSFEELLNETALKW